MENLRQSQHSDSS